MSSSDLAFHMAFQNVLLLQLISVGVCALSTSLPDAPREMYAWIVPTLISAFSAYLCLTMLWTSHPHATAYDDPPKHARWHGVVQVILLALLLHIGYSGYQMVRQRTLESIWRSV